jgi:hypothetical protein
MEREGKSDKSRRKLVGIGRRGRIPIYRSTFQL